VRALVTVFISSFAWQRIIICSFSKFISPVSVVYSISISQLELKLQNFSHSSEIILQFSVRLSFA